MRNLTISINIEYKRNRTWGWNPTATVTASLDGVRTDTTKGTASGCNVTETCDAQGNPVAYTVTRDMPASFVALV